MKQRVGLSNMQKELLKMFNYDLTDTQLREIKQLLARYFQGKIDSEMDELWDKKGWSDAQMDSWAKEHMRKKK